MWTKRFKIGLIIIFTLVLVLVSAVVGFAFSNCASADSSQEPEYLSYFNITSNVLRSGSTDYVCPFTLGVTINSVGSNFVNISLSGEYSIPDTRFYNTFIQKRVYPQDWSGVSMQTIPLRIHTDSQWTDVFFRNQNHDIDNFKFHLLNIDFKGLPFYVEVGSNYYKNVSFTPPLPQGDSDFNYIRVFGTEGGSFVICWRCMSWDIDVTNEGDNYFYQMPYNFYLSTTSSESVYDFAFAEGKKAGVIEGIEQAQTTGDLTSFGGFMNSALSMLGTKIFGGFSILNILEVFAGVTLLWFVIKLVGS